MFSKTMPLKLARNSNPDCTTKANLKDFFQDNTISVFAYKLNKVERQ